MPAKPCQKNGKKGWKWGNSGFCYTGVDAKQKAIEQGKAIHASEYSKKQK